MQTLADTWISSGSVSGGGVVGGTGMPDRKHHNKLLHSAGADEVCAVPRVSC